MSQADVRALEIAYEALNEGDAHAALDVLDPDAEWHESQSG